MENLKGLTVAILVTDGFEQAELVKPRQALDQASAETRIVSPKGERVRAWNFTDWGDEFPVDLSLEHAQPHDFDALLLSGGVMNPDTLRVQEKAVAFVRAFFDARKPVAVICHGPWTIIEAGAARGRFLVRWPALFTIPKAGRPEHTAENAGAGDLRLTEDELARIDEAFPIGPRPRLLPML
jgi:protease I